MIVVPKPYPQQFRDDVVRVARAREAGVTLAQIAKDFGVHEMTLRKWIRQADIDDGNRPGKTREDSTELRIGITTWIERTYHRRRRQARLGRLTPIEYEAIMNPTVSLAA